MKKFARIRCVYTEDNEDTPLVFDVMLENGRIVPGVTWMGTENGFNGEACPFLLMQDGRLNYGALFTDEGAAEYSTNLRDRDVAPGVQFNVTYEDEECVYVVHEVNEF